MAESTKKPRRPRNRARSNKKSDSVAPKTTSNRVEETTQPEVKQAKKDIKITHRTSSEPTEKKLSTKVKNLANTPLKVIRRRDVWLPVGILAAVILLLLTLWWQWQRSYVAVVNGQYVPTTKLLSQSAINSGSQLLPRLTEQYLLEQEAKRLDINISQEAIQSEINDLIGETGGQEQYQETLDQFGIPEEYLKEQIKVELIKKQLTKDRVKVSDEEVRQRYDDNKSVYDPDDSRGFENIKDLIKTEIEQQKMEQEYDNILKTLEEKSHVTTHLDHLNLTFTQFLRQEILTIPRDVVSLFQSIVNRN